MEKLSGETTGEVLCGKAHFQSYQMKLSFKCIRQLFQLFIFE